MAILLNTNTALTLLGLLATFCTPGAGQQCYFPDGSESQDLPCDPSGESTLACCGRTGICLSNGMCWGDDLASRGSCTDKSWTIRERCTGAPACADVFRNTGAAVVRCTDGSYACATGASDCASSNFTINKPWNILIRPDQVPSLSTNRPLVLGTGISLSLSAPTSCPTQATVTVTPPVRFSTVRS